MSLQVLHEAINDLYDLWSVQELTCESLEP